MEDHNDHHDQRRHDRKSPDGVVPITNAMTGERMGHIGNISQEGLMLISRQEIEAGALFQICFTLPGASGEEMAFNVGAVCLWSAQASSPNSYWSGFEIMDVSDDDVQELKTIVNSL